MPKTITMSFGDTNSGSDGQSSEIPIIDLAPLNLCEDLLNLDPYKDLQADDPVVKTLAAEVVKAFSEIGFCYLINHAISQQSIGTFNKKAEEFFKLPRDIKVNYRNADLNDASGWQGLSEEKLSENRNSEADYKQVYNFCPTTIKSWPDKEIPGIKDAVLAVYQSTGRLCLLTLKLMGIGLHLEDPDYFLKAHDMISRPSLTTIRACIYPPVPKDMAQRPGIMRCGEHSDWGSISFVHQDGVGGLEVKNRAGEYVPATPIKDSVLVNIADMMERWTADKLVSTKHRVVIPKEDFEVQRTRQSIAFFALPLNEVSVECLDGSNKYPPISSRDYKIAKLAEARGTPSTS